MDGYRQADRDMGPVFLNCIHRKITANIFFYQNHPFLLEEHDSLGTSDTLSNKQLD